MNLIPTVVEQMQKMMKEELIEVVKDVMLPKVEVEVQVEMIKKMKVLTQKREMSGG